jgi:hypothetical protein
MMSCFVLSRSTIRNGPPADPIFEQPQYVSGIPNDVDDVQSILFLHLSLSVCLCLCFFTHRFLHHEVIVL